MKFPPRFASLKFQAEGRPALLLAACVLWLLPCHAQEAEGRAQRKAKISIEQAVELARKYNIDTQRSKLSMEQSQRESEHSWNKFLPTVSAGVTASEGQTLSSPAVTTTRIGGSLSASLSLNLGLPHTIAALRSAYEQGQLSYESTVRSTEAAVRKSFYNILYLKEKLELAQNTLDSSERQYRQTQQKHGRGLASDLDLLTAQVKFETAKPEVDSARSDYMDALIQYMDAIGIRFPPDVIVELGGSLDDAERIRPPERSVLEGCEKNSSKVKVLEAQLAAAESRLKASQLSTYLPTFTLSGAYNPESLEFRDGERQDTNASWSVSIGARLNLDSFVPGSSASDTLASLEKNVRDLELQLKDAKKKAVSGALSKFNDIEIALKTLNTRKMSVELAQKSYDMASAAYQRGTKDLLTVQNSLDTLHSAQVQLRAQQYALLADVLDLEAELGIELNSFFGL